MILFAAWLQSMLKLTLVPRLFRWGILILAVLPVFFFKDRLAACSFQSLGAFLADSTNLKDFCALIVIQELLALLLGFSLLKQDKDPGGIQRRGDFFHESPAGNERKKLTEKRTYANQSQRRHPHDRVEIITDQGIECNRLHIHRPGGKQKRRQKSWRPPR